MSIFGQILSSILGSPAKEQASVTQAPKLAELPASTPAKAQSATAELTRPIDVALVLSNLAKQTDEDLDWRRSIVDLMKLLKLDSSLTSRKRLAQELGYTGSMNDTASLNIWLHKE